MMWFRMPVIIHLASRWLRVHMKLREMNPFSNQLAEVVRCLMRLHLTITTFRHVYHETGRTRDIFNCSKKVTMVTRVSLIFCSWYFCRSTVATSSCACVCSQVLNCWCWVLVLLLNSNILKATGVSRSVFQSGGWRFNPSSSRCVSWAIKRNPELLPSTLY